MRSGAQEGSTVNVRSKKLWAGTLAAGITTTLGLGFVTSSAPADSEQRGSVATIHMVQDGNQLSFEGPDTINRGQILRIVNDTDPNQIGPHTFSLTKQKLIPSNGEEAKACFKNKPESVCRRIFEAHKVNFEKERVGKKVVDEGREGWNLLFRDRGDGDSWFALKENAQYEAVVSARAGKTLPYFCAIHPEMQGSIDVQIPTK
jgi:plastocyanin